jgi:hypothetical protein
MLGFSDDPEDADYIELDDQTTSKIFSLCQDLVYISNRGKVQTPKSQALAMTVWQMSGCSGLIKILSGFGHCVTLSLTMAEWHIIQLLHRQLSTHQHYSSNI